MNWKSPIQSLFGTHQCKYTSDGGACIHCGKTVSDSLRQPKDQHPAQTISEGEPCNHHVDSQTCPVCKPPAPVEGEWRLIKHPNGMPVVQTPGLAYFLCTNPIDKEQALQLATQIVESVNIRKDLLAMWHSPLKTLEELRAVLRKTEAENQKLREENKSLRDTISDWHSH